MKNLVPILTLIFCTQFACSEAPPRHNAANAAAEAAKSAQSYLPTPSPPQKHLLLDKTFHVDALNFVSYGWTLQTQTRLTGKFSAQGGSNDIACWIVDEDNFVNLKNNTALRVYYESGYTTQRTIDLTLPAGTYYIVFDNRKALLTGKTVTAFFEAEFLAPN